MHLRNDIAFQDLDFAEASSRAADRLQAGEIRGFNPQPEPPAVGRGILSPGDLVGFNPQPEPPAVTIGVVQPDFHTDWLPG